MSGETRGFKMHIAVCDDNFADRHQMERLLGRESDKEDDSSSMYFVDSYGNPTVMLSHPKAYDLFFIDMCRSEGMDSLSIVKALIEKGATAPFVLCCSDVDYRKQDFPENTLFLDKPIKVDEPRAVIAQAKKIKEAAPDTIELRDLMETVYAKVTDVIYAREKDADTFVCLEDGRILKSIGQLWLFRRSLGDKHPEFIYANNHTIINCNCIKAVTRPGIAVMTNGKRVILNHAAKGQVKQYTRKG